jgi:hypothetical protein
MTFTAPFAQTPKTGYCLCTSATSNYSTDAPANTVKIVTAGANGALLTRLTAIPRGTVTATCLQSFLSKDSGTTKRLFDSELMAAHTVAATTAIPETTFGNYTEDTPLRLEAGDEIYVGAAVTLAQGIAFRAEYTDF